VSWWLRVTNVFRFNRLDQDLDDEQRFHVEARAEELTTNENPVYLDTRLDWRAVAFVAAVGCLTTVLFGLAPAIRASAAWPASAAAFGDRSLTAHAGMAHSLIATQIAFSLMILFVATLLLRSFDKLLQVDLGFTPERLALISGEARDRFEPAQAREVARQLREHVGAIAGVESASLSGWRSSERGRGATTSSCRVEAGADPPHRSLTAVLHDHADGGCGWQRVPAPGQRRGEPDAGDRERGVLPGSTSRRSVPSAAG
jgi:hypothetical protein